MYAFVRGVIEFSKWLTYTYSTLKSNLPGNLTDNLVI